MNPQPSQEMLRQRLIQVLNGFRCQILGAPFLTNALAQYEPINPPRLLYRPDLSEHDWLVAVIHELNHACLHPPISQEYDETSYAAEERCAHDAAQLVCAAHGIDDYRQVMVRYGVPDEFLEPGDPALVAIMKDRVMAAVAAPEARIGPSVCRLDANC